METRLYAWFPLDRNGIAKSCDPINFFLTARRFLRIHGKNVLGYGSEAISVRILFSLFINIVRIS